MSTRSFLYFLDGVPQKLLSEAEVKALLVPSVDPPVVVPKPVYGLPRTQVGTRGTAKIYTTPVAKALLEVYSDNPDQFSFRGTNLNYTLLPGVTKPTGAETENYGNKAPQGTAKPEGYRTRYFPDKAVFYEQSTLPDEVLPESLSDLTDDNDYALNANVLR